LKERDVLRENYCMIDVAPLKIIDDKTALGLRVELPESPAPLVMIIARLGFICCGFLNIEVAEKLNVAAAMVSGVKSFDDVLDAEVKVVTSKARALGVKTGIKGKDALKLFL
jgi:uncharacterized protein YunC (DUF1805 family)